MKGTYQQRYYQKQLIGRGNFGRVYLVYDLQSTEVLVAKKIPLEGMGVDQVDRTMREIEIHKKLDHPNIIAFREYFMQEQTLIIIMQYCEYGDLSLYIKGRSEKGDLFEQQLIMNLFIQLVSGVQYLHQFKIVHRDIKPHNVFINEDGVLKLADFGISKALDHTQTRALTLVGTPYYLSPEACKNEGYTSKSDIWALGCVLYELCTLKHAFQGSNVLSLANKITHDPVQPIPSHFSKQLNQLIAHMLEKQPKKRPTALQILNNKYVKQCASHFEGPEGTLPPKKPVKGNSKEEEYSNEFMPDFEQQYSNQFLQDEKFHPRSLSPKKQSSQREQVQISPLRSGTDKLRERCRGRLGEKLFEDIYGTMRGLKSKGYSQIEIESQVRQKYSREQFNLSMDVAQLIYMEDNQ